MHESESVVGIDGCRGGWVCCTLWPDNRFVFDLVDDTRALVKIIERCDVACVDMPIGIPSDGERAVDRRAKKILGRYHARVFMTPTRSVLAEPSYADANRVSRETVGKGLSKQSWHLFPKVRAMDALLRENAGLRDRIVECHPEIALWGLSGRVVASSKATVEGFRERIGILRGALADPEAMFESARAQLARKDAKDDDIVDAMICAVTGTGLWSQSMSSLVEDTPSDIYGIHMNMAYSTP
jgi:predicted RNase H-like nuclease